MWVKLGEYIQSKEFKNGLFAGAPIARLDEEIKANWDDLSIRYKLIKEAYELIIQRPFYAFYLDLPMTPIEQAVFEDIRSLGGNEDKFYPQYPVGKYFVDFGDPFRKIAIECDGKNFHDREKDQLRDLELLKLGWVTHRITGRDCLIGVRIKEILGINFSSLSDDDFYNSYDDYCAPFA